ncbi:MAG: glycosyltransferase family 4 protein [Myxococcota bacterium]|nr:glycosyltransferase family 4 protein [Myxococcota bacterium]
MRILMVAPRLPHPPVGGDRLRLNALLRHLAQRHEVHLFALAEGRESLDTARRELSQLAATVRLFPLPRLARLARCAAAAGASRLPLQVHYFHSERMARALRVLPRDHHDVCLASLVRTAPYVLDLEQPSVVDVQDAISLNYRRALPHVDRRTRWLYRTEIPRLERLEADVVRRAAGITMVSPVDLADLRRRTDGGRFALAGNGVDLDRFAPGGEPRPDRMLFLGNLRTVANRDMASRLAHEVLPRVRRSRPRAELRLVGIEAGAAVQRLDDERGVQVTGPVDDPAAALRRAWLTACPMRLGAGVPNKVIESMACGTPAVVTPMAAAALDLAQGEGVLIADGGADSFAGACARLLGDPGLRAGLSARAREIAEDRFRWRDALAPLEQLLHEVAENPGRP